MPENEKKKPEDEVTPQGEQPQAETEEKPSEPKTEDNAYIDYLNKKFAPKLAKLQKKGYNIYDISNYASKSLNEIKPRFDEVYTEYRVKKMIGG